MIVGYVAAVIQAPNVSGLGTGGSTHALEVARHLTRLGAGVTLACAAGPGQRAHERVGDVDVVRPFRWGEATSPVGVAARGGSRRVRSPGLERLYRVARSVRDGVSVATAFRRRKVDIVYERSTGSSIAGAFASRLLALPLVLEVNDLWLEPIALRWAHGVVGPDLSALPIRPDTLTRQLDWGVDPETFRPLPVDADLKTRFGLTAQTVMALSGSFLPWHGLAETVRAVRIIKERGVQARVLVIGDGPERPRAQALAEELGVAEKFVFVGNVPYDQVPRFIAPAVLGLAPYNELLNGTRGRMASPLKVLEYMACAKPVLVTATANRSSVVSPGESGWVLPSAAPEVLAAAMETALADTARLEAMGAAGRRAVTQRHSWAAHCRNLLDLFQRLVA